MQILIVDLGSKHTLLISQRLQGLGVRSVIFPVSKVEAWLKNNIPKGIILSGGTSSIYGKDFLTPPDIILEKEAPILGICLGMHWLAEKFGGRVLAQQNKREYGETRLDFDIMDPLFYFLEKENRDSITVWQSYGDRVVELPFGFMSTGWTEDCDIACMRSRDIWGVQFHPEVLETECGGLIFRAFAEICDVNTIGCK